MKAALLPLLMLLAVSAQAQESPAQPGTATAVDPEAALVAWMDACLDAKDYATAESLAREFLDEEKGYPSSRKIPDVLLRLGQALEKQGKRDEAIGAYSRIWATYMRPIQLSSPAMKRWMELLWERNRAAAGDVMSDRQLAYQTGCKFILATVGFRDRMTAEELKVWLEVNDLVERYAADRSIVPFDPHRMDP